MPDKKEIMISDMTEKHKLLIAQLPYVEFAQSGLELIRQGTVKLSDLINHLLNPEEPSIGYILGTEKATSKILGKDRFTSDRELVKRLIDSGLGDLKILDSTIDERSGFGAITIEDNSGNQGVVFRGSDFEYTKGAFGDWLCADIGEHFVGMSRQAEQAIDYFKKVLENGGKKFLFGFSLGGNLASHVFNQFHQAISKVFVFNGNPIDKRIMTDESRQAFNSSKYECFIKEGDLVGMSKNIDIFKNNVTIVKNPNEDPTNIISAHQAESVVFDSFGSFIRSTWERAEEILESRPMRKVALMLVQSMSNLPDRLSQFADDIFDIQQDDQLEEEKHVTRSQLASAIVASKKLPIFADFAPSIAATSGDNVSLKEVQAGQKIALFGPARSMIDGIESLLTVNPCGTINSVVRDHALAAIETDNAIIVNEDISDHLERVLENLKIKTKDYIEEIRINIKQDMESNIPIDLDCLDIFESINKGFAIQDQDPTLAIG